MKRALPNCMEDEKRTEGLQWSQEMKVKADGKQVKGLIQ